MGWKQQLTGIAAAASLVMMGASATAQSTASGSQGAQQGQTATSGQEHAGMHASAATGDVDKFYKKAAMGNMAEIQLAKLGAQKAENPQVKQFAQQMVDAHQRSLDQLKEVASGNVEWPSTLDEKHQKAQNKLSGLSGAEFDREFMAATVNAHEDLEDLLENYAGENRMGSADARPGASGTSGTSGTTTGTTTGQTTTGGTSTGAGQSAAGTSGSASTRLSGAAQEWASKALREVRSHLEQAKELKEQVEK